MKQFDNIKSWSDKFESKAAKVVALWGSVAAIVALIPSIVAGVIWVYFLFKDVSNISTYVKEFTAESEYNSFCNMQLISGLHEEMESEIHYGVQLQKTNNGDLWYYGEVSVNGIEKPVIYSANIKNKGKRVKLSNGSFAIAHIYIQNMAGEHEWIIDKIK